MQLKISNFGKPSNKKFKLIADILLYALPAYTLLIAASPFSEPFKLWTNFIIGTAVVTLKAISKFTVESEEDVTLPN